MTREDLDKEYLTDMYSRYSKSGIFDHLVYAIDYIESIENRTCSNCKHLEYIEKSYKKCSELDINIGHTSQDEFYCAYWESKDGL